MEVLNRRGFLSVLIGLPIVPLSAPSVQISTMPPVVESVCTIDRESADLLMAGLTEWFKANTQRIAIDWTRVGNGLLTKSNAGTSSVLFNESHASGE